MLSHCLNCKLFSIENIAGLLKGFLFSIENVSGLLKVFIFSIENIAFLKEGKSIEYPYGPK